MLLAGYNVHEDTVLEIGKFAILWNNFESTYFNNNFNPRNLASVINRINIDFKAQANLANVLNTRRISFGHSINNYVDYDLHPGNARNSDLIYKAYMEEFLNQSGQNIYCGCILTISRIRNNMMHGLKCIGDLNNQIDLFKAVNGVLENI